MTFKTHQIVFIVYPQIALLDLAGPLQVFVWARRPDSGELAYQVQVLSEFGGQIASDSLVQIDTEPMSPFLDRDIDTLVIIGGDGVYEAAKREGFVRDIAHLAARSRRVCSVCSGAYLLAQAGVLKGRKAVTHWQDVEKLRADFSDVCVESDPIYIKDGRIWTSAGVSAGIDMSLALVAKDFGPKAALERAQALVTYIIRPGGQSQFSSALRRQARDQKGRFDDLHVWIADNLGRDLSVEHLADFQNMSVRNFHRAYFQTMQMTPAKAVAEIRLEHARDLLQATSLGMKSIAQRCGFKNEEHLRRACIRGLGVSPRDYRDRFRLKT